MSSSKSAFDKNFDFFASKLLDVLSKIELKSKFVPTKQDLFKHVSDLNRKYFAIDHNELDEEINMICSIIKMNKEKDVKKVIEGAFTEFRNLIEKRDDLMKYLPVDVKKGKGEVAALKEVVFDRDGQARLVQSSYPGFEITQKNIPREIEVFSTPEDHITDDYFYCARDEQIKLIKDLHERFQKRFDGVPLPKTEAGSDIYFLRVIHPQSEDVGAEEFICETLRGGVLEYHLCDFSSVVQYFLYPHKFLIAKVKHLSKKLQIETIISTLSFLRSELKGQLSVNIPSYPSDLAAVVIRGPFSHRQVGQKEIFDQVRYAINIAKDRHGFKAQFEAQGVLIVIGPIIHRDMINKKDFELISFEQHTRLLLEQISGLAKQVIYVSDYEEVGSFEPIPVPKAPFTFSNIKCVPNNSVVNINGFELAVSSQLLETMQQKCWRKLPKEAQNQTNELLRILDEVVVAKHIFPIQSPDLNLDSKLQSRLDLDHFPNVFFFTDPNTNQFAITKDGLVFVNLHSLVRSQKWGGFASFFVPGGQPQEEGRTSFCLDIYDCA